MLASLDDEMVEHPMTAPSLSAKKGWEETLSEKYLCSGGFYETVT